LSESAPAAATTDYGIEMVFVKGGTFTMGCTAEQGNYGDDEKPAHQVTVSDFYMGKFEVTQKQWREIMGTNPSYFKNCDDCPVEQVSWNNIQEFIKKLNQKTGKKYRLPTEAEWEFAARGGVETHGRASKKYAGSNNIDDVAWYSENSNSKTHPVGQKQPNELGLYDMSGNVWEWCSDWYGSYSSGSQTNPQGPSSGFDCVIRGGSWDCYPQPCRVANRNYYSPDDRNLNIGFRLSRSVD
jgi:formylglycine-generating enzyme